MSVEERKGLQKKDKPKNNYLFDIINDIKLHKKGDLLDSEEYENAFNNFMVMRFLAQNDDICEIVNMINEYQAVLSKKQLYKLLLLIVPRTKSFDGFTKGMNREDDENIKYVSLYFECSLKEAREYITILGSEWAQGIRNRFGGKVG
jgi:hypothetical protein